MSQEIELKLELTREAADALAASALLSDQARAANLESTYFDTPDHALAAVGTVLRIRRRRSVRIQTVKADRDASAGLVAQREWERRVSGDTPVLDDATPIAALLGGRMADLAPRFAVRYRRRTWQLDFAGSSVELAMDRGKAIAGDDTAAFNEVELELKQGTPAALLALAREIGAQVPVRLGVIGKAERGYRLLNGDHGAIKAKPVPLDTGMTAAESLRRIAGDCLRQFRLNETILLARHDAEATHQARVALRRMRTAFAIYRKMLDDDRFAVLEREARWLVGALGEARDLDVLVTRAPAGPVRDRLEQARDAAEQRMIAALDSSRARVFPLDLSEWLLTGDWASDPERADRRDRPVKRFATDALDRLLRRVKKRARDLKTIDDASRHRARKAAKQLRYSTEFFAPLFDAPGERRRRERLLAALKALQDELGTLNDRAVALPILDALGLCDAPGATALVAGEAERPHLAAAVAAYRKLIGVKPFWR